MEQLFDVLGFMRALAVEFGLEGAVLLFLFGLLVFVPETTRPAL